MNITGPLVVFVLIAPFCFGENVGTHVPLPLVFEPNLGQAAPEVRFVGFSGDNAFLLTDREVVLGSRSASPVCMQLVGARQPRSMEGQEPKGSLSNYMLGSDPSKSRTRIPNFGRIRYNAIYSHIDLVFHGDRGQLEYDFVVAPGGNSRNIQLEFKGTSGIAVDEDGNLRLSTGSGLFRQWKPVAYQETGRRRTEVEDQFAL